MSITSAATLRKEIQKAVAGDKSSVCDISIFKFYNFYLNTHIKKGSKEDMEIEVIFAEMEEKYPELHREVEQRIDEKIQIIDSDLDD